MAGCLNKIEIWGFKGQEFVEKMQGKYVKMIIGLNSNTPNYIWKFEPGVKTLVATTENEEYKLRVLGSKRGSKKCRSC